MQSTAQYYQPLTHLFFSSMLVRDIISLSVRIVDIDEDGLSTLAVACRNLFCVTVLFSEESVSPSFWTLCHVVPVHAADVYDRFKLGLGITSMEGREQKNQMVHKYSLNTTVQNRWPYIFRHEFLQLIYLRENGFDVKKYMKRPRSYYPGSGDKHCRLCKLLLVNDQCDFCSSIEMKKIKDAIKKVF